MRFNFFIPVLFLLPACSGQADLLFTKISSGKTGVRFKNNLVESETANVLKYTYFYNGGGVAVGDINRDGLQDILFTGNMVPNRLYLNRGNFAFEDITGSSGIAAAQGWCTGATIVDVNADGYPDIYICRSADADPERRKNLLYINNGDLTFTERAAAYGLADKGYSSQAAFFDYDEDGDLDLFLINHSVQEYANGGLENPALRKQQKPEYANKLYRNDHGHYLDVSAVAGITSNVLTFGLGIAVSDMNNDGWPDVYVSNDFNEPDYLFINNRNGSFSEKLSDCMDEVSLFSMGSDAADYNNDGLTDLVTLDMLQDDNRGQKMHNGAENFDKYRMLYKSGFYYQSSRNMLHTNNGDGTFSEEGQMAGISATDWSWSALFCDFDNDGNKDLFVSNGYVKDYTNMDFMKYSLDRSLRERQGAQTESVTGYIAKMPSIVKPDYLFRNNGDGTFTRNNSQWGLQEEDVSSGAAYVDLDNDGDMDLVINHTNEEAGIYRNNHNAADYVKIQLKGTAGNANGIGAKVKLYCGKDIFFQEQSLVRGFQSAVDPILHFGVGRHSVVDSLIVTWQGGARQAFKNVRAGQTITADQKNATAPASVASVPGPIFVSDSSIHFLHRENEFNDFTVQSLMPYYLSRQGPCIAKADVNGDGLEDIFAGGAKGQPSQLFIQKPDGKFVFRKEPSIAADSLGEDVAAAFFDADGDGDMDLYAGSGGYEFGEHDKALQDRLYLNDGTGNFSLAVGSLPEMFVSTGCVKPYDIDGDGDIDLFVGGRVVPGKYPLAPRSFLLINNGKGKFTDQTNDYSHKLKNIGMVTDASWVDVNNDGRKDLVVVGEWMPVTVFENDPGGLKDISSAAISFPSSGLWNTMVAADMDGDGDEDLIIGNAGLNTQFRVTPKEPMTLYYKDFDGNGSVDPLLCYFIGGRSYPAASRDDLTDQLPALRKKFIEYESYADATITDVLSPEQLKGAGVLKAECMFTVYLENRGSQGFKLHELPGNAQLSPVYAIQATDINGDGRRDIILAGNNSWARVKFGKYQANHGVLLENKGGGNFVYTTQLASGLNMRYNVRSMETISGKKGLLLIVGVNDEGIACYRTRF